jgi:hypothetical protein
MNLDIALLLAQDGITNGAIYALLALALVLAFAVTRVIFIPQGEFVAYGALTLVAVQSGKLPGTVWLLLVAGGLVSLIEIVQAIRARRVEDQGRTDRQSVDPQLHRAQLRSRRPRQLVLPERPAARLRFARRDSAHLSTRWVREPAGTHGDAPE